MDGLLSDVVDMSSLSATTKEEFYGGVLALINQLKIYQGLYKSQKVCFFLHMKVALDSLFIDTIFRSLYGSNLDS